MRVRASRIALSLVTASLTVYLISVFRGGTRGCPNCDLSLSISTVTSEVELGKAFPLTVVRTWGTMLKPQAFDERTLAPLVTRLESSSIVDSGSQIEETRRYAAYAFTPDTVTVPAVSFAAKNYDASTDWPPVKSEPLRLRVNSQLDPKSPGVPEEPGPMLPHSRRWLPLAIGGAFALILALVASRKRSRVGSRTPVPSPIPVGPGPDVEALARLAGLRARHGAGPDIVEASDVVRTYAARRFGVRALEMTSNELLAALAQPGISLRAVFDPGDLVKFAEYFPTAEDRIRALDVAESFIVATRAMP